MRRKAKQRVIAIEEHYLDRAVGANVAHADTLLPAHLRQRLEDLGAGRLKEMDDAGIDVQVLSHAGPVTQRVDAEVAVRLSRAANERLHEVIGFNPDRFAGVAPPPTPDPQAAAASPASAVARPCLAARV